MQVARRRREHQAAHPDAHVISLGMGDTTEPIPPSIAKALRAAAEQLGTPEGYSGYAPAVQAQACTCSSSCLQAVFGGQAGLHHVEELPYLAHTHTHTHTQCARRYGPDQGWPELREAICAQYYAVHGLAADEVSVSDGSKCDIGRLQVLPATCCLLLTCQA